MAEERESFATANIDSNKSTFISVKSINIKGRKKLVGKKFSLPIQFLLTWDKADKTETYFLEGTTTSFLVELETLPSSFQTFSIHAHKAITSLQNLQYSVFLSKIL